MLLSARNLDVNELADVEIGALNLDNQTLIYFRGLGIENVADLVACCRSNDERYDENMIIEARAGITFRYGYGLVS